MLIGVANKTKYLRHLWALPNDSKHTEASFSTILTDTLYLRVAQTPRCPDLAIFVLMTDNYDDGQNRLPYPSLVPRPFKRKRRKGLVHFARTCAGGPQKMWGNRILSYTLRLSSIELYIMQNPWMITMVTRPVVMETPVHAHTMCTRPFLLLLLKGLGMRLLYPLHVHAG